MSTRKSPFLPEQKAYIELFFPALLSQSADDLKLWKTNTTVAILDSNLFKGQLPSKEQDPIHSTTLLEWEKRIKKKFTNHASRRKPRPTAPVVPVATRDGFLSFSPLSGMALFEKEQHASITELAMQRAATTKTKAATCYSTCQKELWDALSEPERSNYETSARGMPIGVSSNQADFARAAGTALNNLCRGGQVGALELLLFWAYREPDGSMRHGMIDAHSSDNLPSMTDEMQDWTLNVEEPWRKHAEKTIPYAFDSSVVDPSVIVIPRNLQGVPQFPKLDMKAMSANSISQVLTKYMGQLWEHSSETGIPPPWNEIAEAPSIYYDDKEFNLPTPLKAPDSLGTSQIFALAEYFDNTQFVFRQKFETDELQKRQAQKGTAAGSHSSLSPAPAEHGATASGDTVVGVKRGRGRPPKNQAERSQLTEGMSALKKIKVNDQTISSRPQRIIPPRSKPVAGPPRKHGFDIVLVDRKTGEVVG
ncbi:hypothetical protein FB451DRAFT_1384846 [Mycena latifolia]|nr:hypothetical protein FB451DRAFT_1384846 [Mycena latifolia]